MKILIIDDNQNTINSIKGSLAAENHNVETALDGAEGSFLARNYDFDIIILDYTLPKKDGMQVCREIRQAGKSTPIIFISATEDVSTKVMALNFGADDYIVKPFLLEELHARLYALYRRPKITERSVLKISDLTLDVNRHVVVRSKKEIRLTRKEFSMLEYLIQHQGIVISRAMLLEHVWTADCDPFSNTVEAHMRNLRKKINIGGRRDLISNIPGRGYTIKE